MTLGESLLKQPVTPNLTNYAPRIQPEPSGVFEFVHNVRKRDKALLGALMELLVTYDPGIQYEGREIVSWKCRSDPPKETFFVDDKRDGFADMQACSSTCTCFLLYRYGFALHSCPPCGGRVWCASACGSPLTSERGSEESAEGSHPAQTVPALLYVALMSASAASSRAVCARCARLWYRRAAVRSAMPASRLWTRKSAWRRA